MEEIKYMRIKCSGYMKGMIMKERCELLGLNANIWREGRARLCSLLCNRMEEKKAFITSDVNRELVDTNTEPVYVFVCIYCTKMGNIQLSEFFSKQSRGWLYSNNKRDIDFPQINFDSRTVILLLLNLQH